MQSRSIYDEFGVSTVVNAVGTRTQVGGSLMPPEVVEAMARASKQYVYMTELQARASKLISEVTGAEAGMVTAGAASSLTLGAAACIARDDFGIMRRLPDTRGIPAEIVIPKAHRFKYDGAIRAAGARLVDVGIVSHHPVEGGSDVVEPWEIDDAINANTVAVAYVARRHHRLPLEDVVRVAHAHDLPVLVDAAGEVPPKRNLTRFIEQGADLVAISGGKAIRGPQSAGILAGRRDLIRSAAVQHLSDGYHPEVWDPPAEFIDRELCPGVPRDGLGRAIKVCKEEIVGLMRALELFVEEFDDHAYYAQTKRKARYVSGRLDGIPGLTTRITNEEDPLAASRVIAQLHPEETALDAVGLIRALRADRPHIWVGENRTHLSEVYLDMTCLADNELDYLADRIRHHLTAG